MSKTQTNSAMCLIFSSDSIPRSIVEPKHLSDFYDRFKIEPRCTKPGEISAKVWVAYCRYYVLYHTIGCLGQDIEHLFFDGYRKKFFNLSLLNPTAEDIQNEKSINYIRITFYDDLPSNIPTFVVNDYMMYNMGLCNKGSDIDEDFVIRSSAWIIHKDFFITVSEEFRADRGEIILLNVLPIQYLNLFLGDGKSLLFWYWKSNTGKLIHSWRTRNL